MVKTELQQTIESLDLHIKKLVHYSSNWQVHVDFGFGFPGFEAKHVRGRASEVAARVIVFMLHVTFQAFMKFHGKAGEPTSSWLSFPFPHISLARDQLVFSWLSDLPRILTTLPILSPVPIRYGGDQLPLADPDWNAVPESEKVQFPPLARIPVVKGEASEVVIMNT